MKKTKTLQTIILTVFALILSSHAWSIQKEEPKTIDKKDVVDEVVRSEIEENESSEAPKIDNIVPAFKMPSFKTSVEKSSNKKSTVTKRLKPKPKTEKKQDKVVESAKSQIVEKKPPPPKKIEVKKTTVKPKPKTEKKQDKVVESAKSQIVEKKPPPPKKIDVKKTTIKPKKSNKTKKKKPTIFIKKPLNASRLLSNDTISLVKDKVVIHRLKGRYIYKYYLKSSVPLESKGLKKIEGNRYLVTDKYLLIADIEKHNNIVNVEENKEITDELLSKRKALERKYNKGKIISSVIPATKLNKGDTLYTFDGIQMVTRYHRGRVSTKKYWLFPTMNVNSPALLKIKSGKYKVVKKIK